MSSSKRERDYAASPHYWRCEVCTQWLDAPRVKNHDIHCRAMLAAWGTPDEMLARFRADESVTLRMFKDEVPGVSGWTVVGRLITAGLAEGEENGRAGGMYPSRPTQPAPKSRRAYCPRCKVLYDAALGDATTVGKSETQEPLCNLCVSDGWTAAAWKAEKKRRKALAAAAKVEEGGYACAD